MKRFLVGKTFPIAPFTKQTTALANDQLLFPMLPPPPPPPPLPPVPPLLSARDVSSRRKIHAPGHGAPIGNAVAAEHESFPATTTTTTITNTTTATVIAALASGCFLQLSREGSGCGGGSGHLPHHRTPGYSTITITTKAAPIAVAATATDEGDPEDVERRTTPSVTGEAVGGGRGHCRQWREMMGGVKPVTTRWVR